jgi:TetR/AcrR family transcriptional regulator, cholesterol catabolism regulator
VSAPNEIAPSGDRGVYSRLLRIAARLFRQKGYAASTTRELAEQLGIQKASLYHHIRSKEDLLFEISMESLRRITAAVECAADSAPEDARLREMIIKHIETALNDQDMHTSMLIELRSLSRERRAEVTMNRAKYEAMFRSVLESEQAAGRIRSDMSARYLTLALLNLLNWTIFWFDPNGDLSPKELGDVLAKVYLDGARERTGA